MTPMGMFDTAGNEILRIGRYGNMDSYGPDSAVPEPEIALRFPGSTALSKRFLYITEWRHARITKVKMGYRQEEKAGVVTLKQGI